MTQANQLNSSKDREKPKIWPNLIKTHNTSLFYVKN